MKVFLLAASEQEDYTVYGVYSSQEKAWAAAERLGLFEPTVTLWVVDKES